MKHRRERTTKLWAAVFATVCAAGCANEDLAGPKLVDPPAEKGLLEQGLPFVPIGRALPREVTAMRAALAKEWTPPAAGPEAILVAVKREDLGKRFFLAAHTRVIYRASPGGKPPTALGTKVVMFRVQNDKLFVFDVRDGITPSDGFDPNLVIEAYPIVADDKGFQAMPGSQDYLLFDPSRGLNRFNPLVSANHHEDPYPPEQAVHDYRFAIDLSYVQNFRKFGDGATWEQVFTGTESQGSLNERVWGTLGLVLRRYSDGEGYELREAGKTEYFFKGEPLLVRNQGEKIYPVNRWNLRPGAAPIRWLISPLVLETAKQYPQYDLLGAIKAGIEGWNEVFGFRALEAVMAAPEDSPAEDDKNFFIWDPEPKVGFARANWRDNPNTGEIRGASVYMTPGWLTLGIKVFDPPPGNAPGTPAPDSSLADLAAGKPSRAALHDGERGFGWNGLAPQGLCDLPAPPVIRAAAAALGNLTPKQAVERLITHVVSHEIGHTLGLRHNFKGSLAAAPTSVMDYYPQDVRITIPTAGPYDVAAIKLLYGLDQRPPPQPFCTDDDVGVDPTCELFDGSANPLRDWWMPMYARTAEEILAGGAPTGFVNSLLGLESFLRLGTPAAQTQAWLALIAPVKLGAVSPMREMTHPGYLSRVSLLQLIAMSFLYPAPLPGAPPEPPMVLAPATLASVVSELGGTITNNDAVREFRTRRSAVDTLKRAQHSAAYSALLTARDALTAGRVTLPAGTERELTDDLIARLTAAVTPYFAR